jgi:hypothetical protein
MRTKPEAAVPDVPPLNRIRVETALSRFPVHRLAKKGNISIDLSGDTDFQWKVTYNNEYGQPGPHAYKIDTLVINRRIDEAPRPLPEVLRLGSLRDINRQLGLAEDDTQTVKRALIQNASAFISAKIRFTPKNARDGHSKWREIHYSRYGVVFNGDTLPDGSIAEAVYIVLNAPHRKMLNEAEVRPLDYDYLTQLKPGPQRLYELLSFQIYGAIASARPRAKLIYSEYCMCAPQVRYFTFDAVKKQMFKLHAPHRASGYIVKIDYQQIIAQDGSSDWEMFYTPGPKAEAEHRTFTRRTIRYGGPGNQSLPDPILKVNPQTQPEQTSLELIDIDSALLSELTSRGIAAKKARELLENTKPGQEVMDQIEYVDSLIAKDNRSRFKNPPGMYILYVRDNIVPPADFWSSRKARLHEQAQQAKNTERVRQAQLEIDYEEYQAAEIKRYIGETTPREEYQRMFAQVRQDNRRIFKQMTPGQLDELTARSIAAELKQSGRVPLLSFEEFCRKRTDPRADPNNRTAL